MSVAYQSPEVRYSADYSRRDHDSDRRPRRASYSRTAQRSGASNRRRRSSRW